MHDPRGPVLRSVRRLLLCAASLLAAAPVALAQTPRPSTVTLSPGFAKIESIAYAPNTPPDLTQPAAGSGKLVVTVGDVSVSKDGVTFTNLIFDGQGQLQGVVFQIDQKVALERVAGCTLELPQGQVTVRAPDSISFAGPVNLRLPFRNPDGTPVQASATAVKAASAGGTTTLALEGVTLQGPAGANGLVLPGFKASAAPMKFQARWSGSGKAGWELSVPTTGATMAVPGLASAPDLPLELTVTNLVINNTGGVSFQRAELKTGVVIGLPQLKGFELTIRGGRCSMTNSVPAFEAVLADLTFPPVMTNAAGNGRAIAQGIDIDFGKGLVLEVGKQLSAKIGELKIDCTQMVLDLSPMDGTAAPEAPAAIRGKKGWTGVWFRQGSLKLPLGGKELSLGLGGFVFDGTGLTGTIKTSSGLQGIDLAGFSITPKDIELGFLRSELIKGRVAGTVRVGPPSGKLGELSASVEFSLDGDLAIAIDSDSGLEFGNLGLSITKIKGRLSQADKLLVLSGELSLKDPALRTKISNFRIDAGGRLYLPDEGVLTLDEPAVADLGVIEAEVRRVGFTCGDDGRKLESVSFTGTARFKNPLEGISLGGEIDLEHLTMRRGGPGKPPQVELGGIGLAVTIPELGTVGGSLVMSDELVGFPEMQVLYGDAEFNLKPLGNVGLGVTFLLAPEQQAWFVGGEAMLPAAIKVAIPATPTSPMVPLFEIKGFLGGFGMNVAPMSQAGGIGPIKAPEKELRYDDQTVLMQAGLMLADYFAGDRAWWADTTLTATLNPLMLDLTARIALLDLEGVSGFPSNDEWRKRDRIARAFMNLDLDGTPTLSIGGDFDMNFPSRKFALIDASGEALLRFSATEQYVRMGYWWADSPADRQRPIKISVARALDDYVELSGKMGMVVNFKDKSGEMRLDARAEFKQLPVEASMRGRLALEGVGTERLSASGSLDLRGVADFGLFEAEARGQVDAEYNTRQYRNRFHIDGALAGKVSGVEAEIKIQETFR